MLHLSRYRYFVLATAIVLFLLYQVSRNDGPWNSLAATKPVNAHPGSGSTGYQSTFDESDTADKLGKPAYDGSGAPSSSTNSIDDAAAERELNKIKIPELKENEDVSDHIPGKADQPSSATKPILHQEEDDEDAEDVKDVDNATPVQKKPPSVIDIPDRKINPPDGAPADQQVEKPTAIHWKKMPEHFPVPTESIIPLPTGKPEKIPRIQYQFKEESAEAREKRLARLSQVEAETRRAWSGYKKYAWKHDELSPISKKFRDPFCGWAATLVDSLDTLWIMGMKSEFEDAVEAVADIDFTTATRSEIPVFETTIRYLGGLIAAYDVSGGKTGGYTILLDKAIELAEILMGVFDTPNRMPILYYNWHPESMKQPKRASSSSNLAELGSLSMEFTRLAQITKDNRYYDAVARITDALYDWQERGTTLSGIFPDRVDATGCNKTAEAEIASQKAAEELADSQRVLDSESRIKAPDDYSGSGNTYQGPSHNEDTPKDDDNAAKLVRRIDPSSLKEQVKKQAKCIPQGLTSPHYGMQSFSMGGSQDSTYEYFPKQFLLLGGLEPKYRTMHIKTVEAVKKWLLFRPMTPDDRDILFSAKIQTRGSPETDAQTDFEVAHLTCFIGGMFGMGGRIFDREVDVEIAKKLADGCVWAYESMPSGIMPEGASAVPCESASDCHWNETVWWRHLDPFADTRDEQLEDYYRLQEEAKAAKVQEESQSEKGRKLAAEAEERVGDKPPKEHLSGTGDEGWGSGSGSAGSKDDDDVYGAGESTSNLRDGRLTGRSVTDSSDGGGRLERRTPPPPIEKNLDRSRLNSGTNTPTKTTDDADEYGSTTERDPDQVPLDLDDDPARPQSHKEYVQGRIELERIPPGFADVRFQGYILRPEAIESVWYMYRITGDPTWQDKGWRMWEAIIRHTQTEAGHSAIGNVLSPHPSKTNEMESFWIAETLKYFYLLYAEPDLMSLDDYVLNTEAHFFRRPS